MLSSSSDKFNFLKNKEVTTSKKISTPKKYKKVVYEEESESEPEPEQEEDEESEKQLQKEKRSGTIFLVT